MTLPCEQQQPRQRAVERERPAGVGERAHPRRRDRSGHRSQRGGRVGGDRPLCDPEVARTEGRDLPGEPRLLFHPCQGGEPILHLVPVGVEIAARPAGPPAALEHDLITAFGEHARPESPDPGASIRAAHHDDGLDRVSPSPVPIAAQRHPVRHDDFDVTSNRDIARLRRRAMRARNSTARLARLIARPPRRSIAAGDDLEPRIDGVGELVADHHDVAPETSQQ